LTLRIADCGLLIANCWSRRARCRIGRIC